MDNNNQRIYNVKLFGATGNGVYDSTGVATASSTTFTSVNSVFAAGDVGKIIVILGAGTSGRTFVTTIAGYTSATQVTLTAAPATTVSSNANFLFGTDQTTYIQAAINACYSAGGGTVYIPNGVYVINGALQTSVGGLNMNSQIYIPAGATEFNPVRTHISIIGETKPNFTQYGANAAISINGNTYKGVVLVSTLTSGATGAAMFGTKGATSILTSTYNYNYINFENLAIKVLDNPAGAGPVIGGISGKYAASVTAYWCDVTSMGEGTSSVQPTNDVAGIETTDNSSEAMNYIENCLCTGFKNGFIIGEHVILNNAEAFVCYYGFNFKNGGHATYAGRILSQWCTNDIYFSAANNVFISLLDVEVSTSGYSGGKWYDNVYTIADGSNNGFGFIYYAISVPFVGLDNSHFAITGGSHLNTVANTNKILATGKYAIINTTTDNVTGIQNQNSGSGAVISMKNDGGAEGGIGMYGSVYSYIPFRNKLGISTVNGVQVLTDGGVANGGTNTFDIVTGGYGNTYTARFTGGNPGNLLLSGSLGIGGVTSPGAKIDIQSATNGDGIKVSGTSASIGNGYSAYNSAGNGIFLESFGATYSSVANWQARGVLSSGVGMVINSDVNVASGGTNNIDFQTGGYNAGVTMRIGGGNPGVVSINGALNLAYVAKTANYTATAADHTIDCTSGTFTVTLPTAASVAGREYEIVNSGSGTITIATTSSQTFNNITSTPTTLTLSPVGAGAIVAYKVRSTGSAWIVVGKVKNE